MNLNLESDKIEIMDEIQSGLAYTLGETHVSITELMSNEFIAGNTDFVDWKAFLAAAGVNDETDFKNPEFDRFVAARTEFGDWEEMLVQASNEYTRRKEAEEI